MVIRVPPQTDADMLKAANGLDFNNNRLLATDAFSPGASLWECSLRGNAGIGFWIGHFKPPADVELYAYLALVPITLGSLNALEGKKGWTEPIWRRKGLARALLLQACARGPVSSDFDGMTQAAYDQWRSTRGVLLEWWDVSNSCFVAESAVPASERFDAYPPADRWQLVMQLTP